MVDNVAHELEDLKDVDIITFDIIILSAYVYYAKKNGQFQQQRTEVDVQKNIVRM